VGAGKGVTGGPQGARWQSKVVDQELEET